MYIVNNNVYLIYYLFNMILNNILLFKKYLTKEYVVNHKENKFNNKSDSTHN